MSLSSVSSALLLVISFTALASARRTEPCILVQCVQNPCNGRTCPAFPQATCVANYCGGCNFDFFLDGVKVNCGCGQPQLSLIQDAGNDRTCPAFPEATLDFVLNDVKVDCNLAECPNRPDCRLIRCARIDECAVDEDCSGDNEFCCSHGCNCGRKCRTRGRMMFNRD